MESALCSDTTIKENAHLQLPRINNELSTEKSCSMQSRSLMLDSNEKKVDMQNSCSLARFSSCAEVVTKTNNFHEQQQHVFEEYIRMCGDDSGCRTWTGDPTSSSIVHQASNLHKSSSYSSHHHHSGTSLNVPGYSDCRVDSSWNRYVSGPSFNSETYATEDGSSSNLRSLLKGFSLSSNTLNGTNNNNNAPQASEHNLTRAHLEYQAISAGQIASILSYMQPVNYQQSFEERNECRVQDSRSTEVILYTFYLTYKKNFLY